MAPRVLALPEMIEMMNTISGVDAHFGASSQLAAREKEHNLSHQVGKFLLPTTTHNRFLHQRAARFIERLYLYIASQLDSFHQCGLFFLRFPSYYYVA